MTWYQVERACSHTERMNVTGRNAGTRYWYIETHLETEKCTDCVEADRRAATEAAAEAAKAESLPDLVGSEKQVAWAETLRRDVLDRLQSKVELLADVKTLEDWDSHADTLCEEARASQILSDLGVAYHFRSGHKLPDGRTEEDIVDAACKVLLEAIVLVDTVVRTWTEARWFIDDGGKLGDLFEEALDGELVTRTDSGFNPHARFTLHFSPEDIVVNGEEYKHVNLVNSRWEGCTTRVSRRQWTELEDGSLEVSYAPDKRVSVSDGRRYRYVHPETFWVDRTTEREEGERPRHHWTPEWHHGRYNEFDVPESDVLEETERSVKIALTCSKYEGLSFHHPASMIERHYPGKVTVRFKSDWTFNVDGSEKRMRVSARDLFNDRTNPLDEPGESLAVEQTPWYRVTFNASHVRTLQKSACVTFDWARSAYPGYVVFFPKSLVRSTPGQYREVDSFTVSFPEGWELKLKGRDGTEVVMTPDEFVAATDDWHEEYASSPPQKLDPPVLEPDDIDVDIPAELLAPLA